MMSGASHRGGDDVAGPFPGNPIMWASTESVPQVRWPCAAVEFASKKPTEKRMQIVRKATEVGFCCKEPKIPTDGCT